MQNMTIDVCFWLGLVILCPEPKRADVASQGATFCQIYQPIQWSAKDTRGTKEQVDSNNRVWKELCKKNAAK